MIKLNLLLFILLAFSVMLTANCDGTINPITSKGIEYSMYGPLNIHETPNFIRVHDTNALLNPESTKELNVNMTFTNLATGEVNMLQERVVIFDDIYTHNYVIEMPIEYDTRYKLFLEDENGFRDSVISQTTKQTNITVTNDTVDHCDQFFFVELSNIDLDAFFDTTGVWYMDGRQREIMTIPRVPNKRVAKKKSEVSRHRFVWLSCLNMYGWEIEAATIADEVFIYRY